MNSTKSFAIEKSRPIEISGLIIGGGQPVVIQSMANTDTNNIEGSIAQAKKILSAGGKMVRYTTQGLKEVHSIDKIIHSLRAEGVHDPIVADVHFSSKTAFEAARVCDKVRINPGNFTEKKGRYDPSDPKRFKIDKAKNSAQFAKLVNLCKEHQTAIRIGVNHGSLSERMMDKYGDTPEGMVASAMEFLKFCEEEEFYNVVVSVKSSNTGLMTRTVRLLVKTMIGEGLYFPVHLGVTESGDGLEGRIKSAVGMAPLLLEGIGDTVRVSLTEPPENEIPVAESIVQNFKKPATLPYHPFENLPWNPFRFNQTSSNFLKAEAGKDYPLVVSGNVKTDFNPDIVSTCEKESITLKYKGISYRLPLGETGIAKSIEPGFAMVNCKSTPEMIKPLFERDILVLDCENTGMTEIKHWLINFQKSGVTNPVILKKKYGIIDEQEYAIRVSGEFGFFLVDQLLDGIWIENHHHSQAFNAWLSFYILQASGSRITSTEYIACPSCGRTLFNIQKVLGDVKQATNHLTGLKIAVMGCIVNGPGEMADADYGYIGSGKKLVSIYKGKALVRKNIPEESAIEVLVETIKQHGDWVDP